MPDGLVDRAEVVRLDLGHAYLADAGVRDGAGGNPVLATSHEHKPVPEKGQVAGAEAMRYRLEYALNVGIAERVPDEHHRVLHEYRQQLRGEVVLRLGKLLIVRLVEHHRLGLVGRPVDLVDLTDLEGPLEYEVVLPDEHLELGEDGLEQAVIVGGDNARDTPPAGLAQSIQLRNKRAHLERAEPLGRHYLEDGPPGADVFGMGLPERFEAALLEDGQPQVPVQHGGNGDMPPHRAR